MAVEQVVSSDTSEDRTSERSRMSLTVAMDT